MFIISFFSVVSSVLSLSQYVFESNLLQNYFWISGFSIYLFDSFDPLNHFSQSSNDNFKLDNSSVTPKTPSSHSENSAPVPSTPQNNDFNSSSKGEEADSEKSKEKDGILLDKKLDLKSRKNFDPYIQQFNEEILKLKFKLGDKGPHNPWDFYKVLLESSSLKHKINEDPSLIKELNILLNEQKHEEFYKKIPRKIDYIKSMDSICKIKDNKIYISEDNASNFLKNKKSSNGILDVYVDGNGNKYYLFTSIDDLLNSNLTEKIDSYNKNIIPLNKKGNFKFF